ncbi:DeoR/GlpR family DNA-binding transcription regulator [Hwangdonia lutea]|uniref:DeoR/GlpR family DNA-binding transcription regulator n=1 Tax=Hwangdonia lutea TaxID=3075823 RepID=A0AA97END1_9FLAO|nr:DeoR/GlpR family DNA-binding transcription regulator [Hwangdonia sp. SCSIO 19198]WOD43163.1 DeoR/GlpR family DNA-binding transcription regulator [Hwangdonia sp. SCSIO 19198]
MVKNERQRIIIDKIRVEKKVSSSVLAEELSVSEDTIRRDLNELDGKGLLSKIHGGAVSTIQKLYHYNDNVIVNSDKKEIIANKASTLIKNGMSIIISGGTTNLAFVRLLPKELKITIYTYCLPIAMELTGHPNIEIIFIGGKIHKKAMVTVGIDVIQKLAKIKADMCFIGTGSLDVDNGITEGSYEVALMKKAMIEVSNATVSLVTSNKLGLKQSYHVCSLTEVDAVVTDLDIDNELLLEYQKSGVNIL